MKIVSPVSVLVCVALPLILLAQAPVRSASIEGTVVDASTGKPLPNVRTTGPGFPITLQELMNGVVPLESTPTALSGEDGRFVLERLGEGVVVVPFERDGYFTQRLSFDLIAGQRTKDVMVRMVSRGSRGVISGRLLDRTGQPAVLVIVILFHYQTIGGNRRLVRASETSKTDDRGEFRIANLMPDRYFVVFTNAYDFVMRTPEMVGAVVTTPVGAGGRGGGGVASGVTRYQGLPTLYPAVQELINAELVDVKGDEETRLRTVALAANRIGQIRISVINGPGEFAKDAEFTIAYATPGFDSTGRAAGVQGGVYDRRALRIEGAPAILEYWPTMPGLLKAQVQWKEPDGTMGIAAVPIEFTGANAEATLIASKPRGRLNIRGLREQPDGTLVPLARASIGLCRVQGSVCAASEFWIASESIGPDAPLGFPVLGTDGTIQLAGIPDGQYKLHLLDIGEIRGPQTDMSRVPPDPWKDAYVASVRQGDRDALLDGVNVSEDAVPLEILVRANPGKLVGRVLDRQGRAVISALVVVAPEPPRDAAELVNLHRTVRTDQAGAFELSGIIPGDYRVYAWSSSVDSKYLDPDFLASFTQSATRAHVDNGNPVSLSLKVLNEQ